MTPLSRSGLVLCLLRLRGELWGSPQIWKLRSRAGLLRRELPSQLVFQHLPDFVASVSRLSLLNGPRKPRETSVFRSFKFLLKLC